MSSPWKCSDTGPSCVVVAVSLCVSGSCVIFNAAAGSAIASKRSTSPWANISRWMPARLAWSILATLPLPLERCAAMSQSSSGERTRAA
jgi:hypothetical protein